MKVIEDIHGVPKDQILHVLIGDGRTELNFLPSIFGKYPRNDVFVFVPFPSAIFAGAGFSVLRGIRNFPVNNPSKFIFIADMDCLGESCLEEKISEAISGFASITDKIIFEPNAGKFKCSGQRQFTVYACLSGKKKMIEEDLAHFLKLEKGLDVPGTKEINYLLKSQHHIGKKDIQEIISKSSRENLKRSFASIDAVLSHIEKNGI